MDYDEAKRESAEGNVCVCEGESGRARLKTAWHGKEREQEMRSETEMDVCRAQPGKYEENNREEDNKRERTFFQRVSLYTRGTVCVCVFWAVSVGFCPTFA